MADYIFTQNGDNNVQIGTDRLTGDFKGASMFATVEQARQYNRLRQYEDTGLTPDEIAALRAENKRLKAERKEMTLRVNDALQYLDAINEQGEIEYSDYSALYDNIVKIDTTAEVASAALEGGQHGPDQA